MVTGIRYDPYANVHRTSVEEQKPAGEQGYYLHPELYGQPETKGVEWAKSQRHLHPSKTAEPDARSVNNGGGR